MKIETKIQRFAKGLQERTLGEDVNNFYAARRTNLQRYNLQLYLQQMRLLVPNTLLVGEAPGYNGCARTGVPFSSEKLIADGVLGGKLFGVHNGYKVTNRRARYEQTAASMWEAMDHITGVDSQVPAWENIDLTGRLPILWNAFPFHPHHPGSLNSNRKPRRSELRVGMEVLEEVIALFSIERIIAVGNAAEEVLCEMDLEHSKVRHPSYGGKREFFEGLTRLLG